MNPHHWLDGDTYLEARAVFTVCPTRHLGTWQSEKEKG